MKIILALFSAAIFVSCGSVCSPTNGACTFGSIDVRSSEINFLSNSNFKNRNYEATVIKDLSPDPILIENIDSELIARESNRPLNLPTNLLQYRPDSYKIGIGDRLFIYVYGETERLSASLVSGAAINPIFEKYVRDDGTIFYPNAGIIDVQGLTVEQIRQELTNKLAKVLNNPQVDVSVSEFNSKKVTVSGTFENPGTYPITTVPLTLSQIVSNANAFSIQGSSPGDLTSLKFTRDGFIYDLDYEYLARKSQIQNLIYLKDGDVIHLPGSSENLVHVLGEAFQPKSIKMERSKILLSSALSQASGLNKTTAKGKDVFIYRPKDFEGKPRIFKADLSSSSGYLLAGKFNLQSQDIVYIGTRGVTSWSRFVRQLIPFTDILNSAQSTDIVTNKGF
jgi:polysaccharide export outer membrane protein